MKEEKIGESGVAHLNPATVGTTLYVTKKFSIMGEEK